VACSNPVGVSADPEDDTVYTDTCGFKGTFSRESVADFQHRVSELSCSEVTVTSFGGDAFAALDFVDFVNKRGIQVRLLDHCHSACVQLVGLLSNDVYVHKDTLMIMHGFAFSGSVWLEANAPEETEFLIEAVRLRTRIIEAVEANGGNPDFLFEPIIRMLPQCIVRRDGRAPIIASATKGWMPTRRWFEIARGTPVKGYWIEDIEHYTRVFNSKKSEIPGMTIAGFGGPIVGEAGGPATYDAISFIQRIPECQTGG
jgi:hypothetical protein